MNFTLIGTIALMAFITDSTAQFGFAGFGVGPPITTAGWPGAAFGQEASKNAANFVANNAITKANSSDLPPELQDELQRAIAEAEFGLAACDDLLVTSSVWRYKICKFQEIGKLKLKVQELKLKAATLASSTTTAASTQAGSSFQSDTNSESTA